MLPLHKLSLTQSIVHPRSQKQSSRHLQFQLVQMIPVIPLFTCKQYLQKHSLFDNLYSSQTYSLSCQETQIMGMFFGKDTVQENQLYQWTYFHKRDRKLLFYWIVLKFLKNQNDGAKSKMAIIQNIQRCNKNQLKSFLANKNYGGSDKILKDYETRICWYYSKNLISYKFNLSYLALHKHQDAFLKCVMILDINTFESSDKLSQQKYYRRIQKSLLIFSFRRDIYDYKVIQLSNSNPFYQQQHGEDKYQLNQKITTVLKKKYQGFKNRGINFIVPVQYLGIGNKQLKQYYKTCLIRMQDQGGYHQYNYQAYPFVIDSYRKINN